MKEVYDNIMKETQDIYRGQTFGGIKGPTEYNANPDGDTSSFAFSNSRSIDDVQVDRRAKSRPQADTNISEKVLLGKK